MTSRGEKASADERASEPIAADVPGTPSKGDGDKAGSGKGDGETKSMADELAESKAAVDKTRADKQAAAEDDKAAAAKAADDKKADDKKPDDKKADDKAKREADDKAEKAKRDADDKAEKAKRDAEKQKREAEDKAKRDAEKQKREAAERAEALKRPPPAPPWWRTLRADPPPQLRLAFALLFIALLFGLWWFVTRGGDFMVLDYNGRKHLLEVKFFPSVERIVSYVKIPSPGEVLGSFDTLWDDQEFIKHLMHTLERVFFGVGLAAIVGVSVGVLAAAVRGVNAAIAPLVIFLRSVPMGPLLPLSLMLFGEGETQKTRFIFLAIVAFVFSDTVKAVSIVPERYVETAQTLGASRWQIVRKVLVPLALPDIVTSLRFQVGLGLGYITLAEVIDTEWGIGKLINISERTGQSSHVYLTLILIAFVAFTIDLVLRTLQRGGFAWRKDL